MKLFEAGVPLPCCPTIIIMSFEHLSASSAALTDPALCTNGSCVTCNGDQCLLVKL